MGKIANWGDLNSLANTVLNSDVTRCPTYTEIIATNKFSVSNPSSTGFNYTNNQLVELGHCSVGSTHIVIGISLNKGDGTGTNWAGGAYRIVGTLGSTTLNYLMDASNLGGPSGFGKRFYCNVGDVLNVHFVDAVIYDTVGGLPVAAETMPITSLNYTVDGSMPYFQLGLKKTAPLPNNVIQVHIEGGNPTHTLYASAQYPVTSNVIISLWVFNDATGSDSRQTVTIPQGSRDGNTKFTSPMGSVNTISGVEEINPYNDSTYIYSVKVIQ